LHPIMCSYIHHATLYVLSSNNKSRKPTLFLHISNT
jgi:hypothetical protein